MSWEGDAFVARLTAEGSGLLYGTFLGGYNSEHGNAIAVDDAGRVTVAGSTTSYSFPTTANAFDPSFNDLGDPDAFVARLSMSQISIAASQIDQPPAIDGDLDGLESTAVAGTQPRYGGLHGNPAPRWSATPPG